MNIEVGEYVRTKDKILKVERIEKDCRNVDCLCFTTGEIYTRELSDEIIVNHSKDLIDLIEVGDFVNGYKILEIANIKNSEQRIFTICKSDFKSICKIWEEQDIQTILTKEQYKANCYTVERNEEC